MLILIFYNICLLIESTICRFVPKLSTVITIEICPLLVGEVASSSSMVGRSDIVSTSSLIRWPEIVVSPLLIEITTTSSSKAATTSTSEIYISIFTTSTVFTSARFYYVGKIHLTFQGFFLCFFNFLQNSTHMAFNATLQFYNRHDVCVVGLNYCSHHMIKFHRHCA